MADDDAPRKLRAEYCFGCSDDNPQGLHLRFERTGETEVRSQITLRPELCGWRGVAHGGFIGLLVDEATSWCMALCVEEGERFATRELSVRYLRPTPTGEPLTLIGRLVEDRGPTTDFLGEVRLADGSLTARGKVQIVRLDRKKLQRFADMDREP